MRGAEAFWRQRDDQWLIIGNASKGIIGLQFICKKIDLINRKGINVLQSIEFLLSFQCKHSDLYTDGCCDLHVPRKRNSHRTGDKGKITLPPPNLLYAAKTYTHSSLIVTVALLNGCLSQLAAAKRRTLKCVTLWGVLSHIYALLSSQFHVFSCLS